MKRTDYICLLTSSLLSVPETAFPALSKFVRQRFELSQLRAPQKISIGIEQPDGQLTGLLEEVTRLRSQSILSIGFLPLESAAASLPAHLAAAFAGASSLLMQVKTSAGLYCYTLRTQFSPAYAITPTAFASLVNAQTELKTQWPSIEKLIQDSHALNQRPLIGQDTAETYLQSPQGFQTFDWLINDFVKELQLNAWISRQEFIIPPSLQHLFEKSGYVSPFPSQDYTYLYPVTEIGTQEMKTLISTQPFADEVWEKCNAYYTQYPGEISFTSAQEWGTKFHTLSDEQVNDMAGMLCRFICECCDEKKTKPVMPAELKSKFGPDETESLKIKARTALQDTQWFLTPNRENWELNLFQSMPCEGLRLEPPAAEILKTSLSETLKAIEAFAARIGSGYSEAFRLALYFLDHKVPQGSFDEAHKARIIHDLNNRGFQQQALDVFSNVFYYAEELLLMQRSPEEVYAFMACSIADVFGGMGSWNDQYMDATEDQSIYEQLSSDLYRHLRNYFASLLSYTAQ